MTENEAFALVQAQSVDDAGVRLGIVDDHVAGGQQAVDDRDHALVTEIEQEGILLADKRGQLTLQTLVVNGLSAHHAGAHRGRHAELRSAFGVGLAHLGVVGQSEVIVQAPVEHLLAPENHVGTDVAFEFGKGIITVGVRHVLTDRSARIFLEACKNINHICLVIMSLCLFFPFWTHKSIHKTESAFKSSRFLFHKDTHLYLFSKESRQHIHKHTWAETGNNSMSIFYESTDNLLTDGLCLLFFGCILLLVCYSMVPLFCYLLVTCLLLEKSKKVAAESNRFVFPRI